MRFHRRRPRVHRRDAAAEAERYNERDPRTVGCELTEAAASVADAFAAVPPSDRGRTGRRSDGARFTVTTLGQYFLHDLVHHLHDVADVKAGAR